jgi:hypothetical protein
MVILSVVFLEVEALPGLIRVAPFFAAGDFFALLMLRFPGDLDSMTF